MIKYKNNINVGTGSVGYEADATSAAPLDSVNEGRIVKSEGRTVKWNQMVNTDTTEVATVNGHKYLTKINGVKGITTSTGAAITINDVSTDQVFDLTQMFGAGNEPTTVEAFESWLAENMVEQDYYPYDAGSLVPVTVKGVKRNVGGTTVTNPMPVTTLKDENGVVMFPDGLKSAGSVKDEIDWEHGVAVKRVGVVDLGNLTWVIVDDGCFYADLQSKHSSINLICSKYQTYNENFGWNTAPDKSIGSANNQRVYCKDSDYTDATTFTTAMQGVLLYYELATPVTYHFATHTELKKRIVKIGESVEVDGIEGETVVWNQLTYNGNFANGKNGWGIVSADSFTVLNGVCTVTTVQGAWNCLTTYQHPVNVPINHKCLACATIKASESVRVFPYCSGQDSQWYKQFGTWNVSTIKQKFTSIVTNNGELSFIAYEFLIRGASENSIDAGVTVDFENVMLIDLTQMFGSGNEPSTVAEFESWLSAHGGIKNYYPYCAGELKDKEEGNVRGVTQNPYKSITRSVDLTTLKGKVNGAGEDVVMFPDGMKQAESVKDEIFVEGGVVKAVKRVGSVDLGELTWGNLTTLEGWDRFNAAISDAASPQQNKAFNAISPKLNMKSVSAANADPHLWDAAFWIFNTPNILVYTPSGTYTSTTDFTTAMQGVMLNYELESPVTYVVNMQGMEMAEVKKVMVGTNLIYEK